MTKIRKLKRKKKYRYNINRKRMNKKRLPTLSCKTVKKSWDTHMSSQKNFKKMGLVFDVNNDIKMMNKENKVQDEDIKDAANCETVSTSIVEELKQDCKEAKVKNFKLPKGVVEFLTYMMDKYGDDYKAMSKDKKNYLQQTWKQIRSKINTFKKIPEQYNEYLSRKESVTTES